MTISFEGKLWKYQGQAAWYFMTLPSEYTQDLKSLRDPFAKNFGSIRVTAKIGSVSWQTSIFPDSKSDTFLLPVKKEVRTKADMIENQPYHCEIVVELT